MRIIPVVMKCRHSMTHDIYARKVDDESLSLASSATTTIRWGLFLERKFLSIFRFYVILWGAPTQVKATFMINLIMFSNYTLHPTHSHAACPRHSNTNVPFKKFTRNSSYLTSWRHHEQQKCRLASSDSSLRRNAKKKLFYDVTYTLCSSHKKHFFLSLHICRHYACTLKFF